MTEQKPLDEITWIERYKPIMNPFDLAADCNGSLFNPQGPEREYLLEHYGKNPRTIWTYMDDGSIVSGFHFVNRQGHFICTVPFGEDDDFIINSDNEGDEEEETDGQAFFDTVVEADIAIDLVENLSNYEAARIYRALKAKFEEPLRAIHQLLDGREWSPATLDEIADIVGQTGREIREPGEE